jgi:hypothetical protein
MAHHHHSHSHDPEKQPQQTQASNAASTITIAAPPSQEHQNHPHLHHTGRRLRHFLRPDGRKVHIVQSPDEAEKLRKVISRRASQEFGKKGDFEFDIVVHGSVDHVNALRETHNHHEKQRDNLRIKHGDLFDEFERVMRELDRLSTELHMVSEHAVQLDANFEKYGYSAHLSKSVFLCMTRSLDMLHFPAQILSLWACKLFQRETQFLENERLKSASKETPNHL